MSAFIVSKSHIDALVTAAAAVVPGHHDSGLSWWSAYAPDFDGIYRTYGRDAYFAAMNEQRRELSYSDAKRASEVGSMLWATNAASVLHRYPDTIDNGDYPGPVDFSAEDVFAYTFRRTATLSPVQILKAIACYEYQSCEHDGWQDSEARSFCDALRDKMIRQLEGYDSAAWELDEDAVRPRSRV